jgi:hypothetical protein
MRFMKSVMAICAVCACTLAMTGIRRSRMKKSGHKRRGPGAPRADFFWGGGVRRPPPRPAGRF